MSGASAVLLRVRLVDARPQGKRSEREWLALALEGWEQSAAGAAARCGAEQRVSRSDPSLASLERGEARGGPKEVALCEWVAQASQIGGGAGPGSPDQMEGLERLAARALESLCGGREALCEPLPGRWSDRLLASASGAGCAELGAWRAIEARAEREELGEQTAWDGRERRSKERGSL